MIAWGYPVEAPGLQHAGTATMPPQHAALLAAVATMYLTQRLSPAGAGSCGVPGIHVSATVETESALSTVVNEYSTDGIAGYTTYRVAVNLLSPAQNIYTILCVRLFPSHIVRQRAFKCCYFAGEGIRFLILDGRYFQPLILL